MSTENVAQDSPVHPEGSSQVSNSLSTETDSNVRQRTLTEKGKSYQFDIMTKQRSSAQRAMSKQIDKLRSLCRDSCSLEELESERSKLDLVKEELNQAYHMLNQITDSDEERELSYTWFDSRDREYNECRQIVSDKVRSLERERLDKGSVHSSKKSRDSRSSRSSKSSVTSMRAKAAAKIAKLEVELMYLDRETEHQKLLKAKEIAIARAEEEAIIKIARDEGLQPPSGPPNCNVKEIEKDKSHSEDTLAVKPESPTLPSILVKPHPATPHHATPHPATPLSTVNPDAVHKSSKIDPRSLWEFDPYAPSFEPKPISERKTLTDHCLPLARPSAPLFDGSFDRSGVSEVTLQEILKLQTKQAELSAMLVENQQINSLPKQEPPVFKGDHFDYPIFIRAFESIIESKVRGQKDRLYFLNKYTSGKANEVIKSFITLNSDDGYTKAKDLLSKRFGDPHRVSDAYKRKLKEWPRIIEGDSEGLQAFSDFLGRCEEAMKTMSFMDDLNSSETLKGITAKLPSYSGVKWCRHAFSIKERTKEQPKFQHLNAFIRQEADLATDPVFSPDSLKLERKRDLKGADSRKKGPRVCDATSFSTSTNQDSSQGAVHSFRNRSQPKCPLCTSPHSLAECKDFKKKSIADRKEFIKSKRLCFGCFREGHISRNCRNRMSCDECGKLHPTSLHENNFQKPQPKAASQTQEVSTDVSAQAFSRCNASSGSNSSDNSVTNSLIIPVLLHHKNNSQNKVKVYALLDEASDTTFVKNDTLQELGISGVETKLNLFTMSGRVEIATQKIDDLIVTRLDERVQIELPKVYTRDKIPSRRNQIPTTETASKWPHLQRIADKIHPYQELDVGLLIGCNCPKAIKPREVILGKGDDPYAVRTLLGWGIIGPVGQGNESNEDEVNDSMCNRVLTQEVDSVGGIKCSFVASTPSKEVINPTMVKKMFEMDFSERKTNEQSLSQQDRRFLSKVNESICHLKDNHYQMELPFKEESVNLPNNRDVAVQRLNQLKRKLEKDKRYKDHYITFMTDMLRNGHAEKVCDEKCSEGPVDENVDPSKVQSTSKQNDTSIWYIPHHGVYHPKKPDKLRVVFDCSAQFRGESLNKHLLQGPDLTNNLVGVLTRFRQNQIAFMCDIEGMFHQVKVAENCRNLLRFLWWEDGDISKAPTDFRMTVHLFGAASSPGCSNFALKSTANDNEEDLGQETANFLRKDFYVDDGLKSVSTVKEAVSLIKNVKEMCRRGGFNLHKFVSNSNEVIESIPRNDRASGGIKSLDIDYDTLSIERALGVQWCIENDSFQFHIILKDRPLTRRGILSTVSSIYDPLGLVAPVILAGKRILQDLCRNNAEWDDPIPEETRLQWQRWRDELPLLEQLSIPRCFKPKDFGRLTTVELHHFSDASISGYGQCSYIRMKDNVGRVHCSLAMGKARVTPLKPITIPRLELTAALISVKISQVLKEELEFDLSQEVFWTDSKVVLGYIANEARRFHIFVANRVQQIQDHTSTKQWRYVPTKSNPADDASRGLTPSELTKNSRWLKGPEFLWKDEIDMPEISLLEKKNIVDPGNPEVKQAVALGTSTQESVAPMLSRLDYFSDWQRAKRAIALCCKYKAILQNRLQKTQECKKTKTGDLNKPLLTTLTVDELHRAEHIVVKLVQEEAFSAEMQIIRSMRRESELSERQITRQRNQCVKKTSSLYRLDPFLDKHGILRVGGRIRRAYLPFESKHPMILPRRSHVTQLIVKHYHQKMQHQGRGMTLNEIRSSGFWIIGGSSTVNNYISSCVDCRKRRRLTEGQKMADLPEDRLEPAPPFTNSAVDYFGPFMIKEGRKELKRYGVLFTCMASRAIHLEVAHTMETDSFISAYRRFISRRGAVRQLRSDQGSNFVGAKRELKECLAEFDNFKIHSELLRNNCDWIQFKMNAPCSSHMGGVWERQIRTVRSVLSTLLDTHGKQLDNESLCTYMCEVEAIVNSRPLSVDNINDANSLNPLTPNHLLTMKTKVILQPPGVFESADLYSRKRWRRVQHLANEFWCRWRKEYLQNLQQRQKWLKPRRNLQVNDVVIIKDADLPRNKWSLARVTKVNLSTDGYVRTVDLAVGDSHLDRDGKRVNSLRVFSRPVHKLVFLMSTDAQ